MHSLSDGAWTRSGASWCILQLVQIQPTQYQFIGRDSTDPHSVRAPLQEPALPTGVAQQQLTSSHNSRPLRARADSQAGVGAPEYAHPREASDHKGPRRVLLSARPGAGGCVLRRGTVLPCSSCRTLPRKSVVTRQVTVQCLPGTEPSARLSIFEPGGGRNVRGAAAISHSSMSSTMLNSRIELTCPL